MKEAELRRFAPLYWHSRWYGADDTLRAHLGLSPDHAVPLALPHGVDFGHVDPVQDLLAVEPLHWAHNAQIAAAAAPFKPVVSIPHPFLLELGREPKVERRGTLVVGPPPGPANDQRLRDRLRHVTPAETTILVKPKPGYRQSMAYWRSHGFAAATLGDFGVASYRTMAQVLLKYERVVGCTFSSLIVFAAATDAEVELLRDYHYDCYDLVEVGSRFEVIAWESTRAAAIVRAFAFDDRASVTDCALDILGHGLDRDPAILRAQLTEAIVGLSEPVYWRRRHSRITRRLVREAALRLGRPGILRLNPRKWLGRFTKPEVWARDMNEIGAWLYGRTADTVTERRQRYVAGRTEPGDAVQQYSRA